MRKLGIWHAYAFLLLFCPLHMYSTQLLQVFFGNNEVVYRMFIGWKAPVNGKLARLHLCPDMTCAHEKPRLAGELPFPWLHDTMFSKGASKEEHSKQ
uniref:Putative secreted protein n=1 Tax=Ixodes ricinus TaxID=34613 RepID=A0A6B0U4M1_IXORI